MKNKLLIFLLLGVFCINIRLIADNYRLKNDYKLAYLSAENIQSEMIDNVEANNNNLENINRLMVLVDNLEIKELSSIDINSNYLILTLEVADIERLKVIETSLSQEIKLGTPEMEIYFLLPHALQTATFQSFFWLKHPWSLHHEQFA